MIDDTDPIAVPIGESHTDDPYDAEYGGWTPEDLVALVEAVVAFHGAVWPEGEVGGDGDPAGIILGHAEMARLQVVKLRELAVEVNVPHRAAWIGDRARHLLAELADYCVIDEPAALASDREG